MRNKKIIIIAALLIAAVLVWLFWPEIKAMFAKKEEVTPTDGNKPSPVNTQNNGPAPVTIKPIKIGDTVIAAKDLVKAFDQNLTAVVKTYKKGDFIGSVKKNENGWLTVQDTAGNKKQIQKANVKKFQS